MDTKVSSVIAKKPPIARTGMVAGYASISMSAPKARSPGRRTPVCLGAAPRRGCPDSPALADGYGRSAA
ncbi:hypothetical protein MPRS_08610 [Mycobacterium paraseoulense]|nr:hypothetical protein MPRS_08610 [Mycobacterium paraseoulense]